MPWPYSIQSRNDGDILDAAKYNADHQTHVDNAIPGSINDYANDVAQLRTAVDPGEVGAESLPTTLAGELERLRFAIREIKGTNHWYETGKLFQVSRLATGGDGSSGSPWTGWEAPMAALPAEARIRFHAGHYTMTTPVIMKQGWHIYGDGQNNSIVTVTGNIRGFAYEPVAHTDTLMCFEDLQIRGSSNAVGQTLNLISLKNVSFVYINRCKLTTSSTEAVKVNGATQVRIANSDIEATRNGGIYLTGVGSVIGVVNGWEIANCWFEHGMGSAIILNLCHIGSILDCVFEGLDGGLHADAALWCEGGATQITFEGNYSEEYAPWNIVTDAVCHNLRIINNYFHSTSNAKIQMRGKGGQAPAHHETIVMHNIFAGINGAQTKLFIPSENQLSYYFDFNYVDPTDPQYGNLIWVDGFPNTVRRVYRYPASNGRPAILDGWWINGNDNAIYAAVHKLTLDSNAADGMVALRVAGGDRVTVVQADTTIANNLKHTGTGVGFYNATPIAKPTVTGSRGGNAALADLLTKGALMGLWVDGTSA